jgi:hypothetical protein
MKLSSEQLSDLIAKLNHLYQSNNGCPICKGKILSVSPYIFEIREYNEGNIKVGPSPLMPLVTVTCTTCGHTALFNAIQFGYVTPQKKEG